MKTLFTLSLLLLVHLATAGYAWAQPFQTRTGPAGFLTTTLAPSPNGSVRTMTPFSCPLHAPAIFSGTVGNVAGNVLTLTSAALPDLSSVPYLIHVTQAANAAAVGQTFLVTAATATTVSANPANFQLSSLLAANDQVLVYAANTLGSIFGFTDSAVKLQGAATASNADLIYLWNGTSWDGYFYNPGTGWLLKGDATATLKNNVVIYPDRALLVARISTNTLAPADVLVQGSLPQNAQAATMTAPGTTFVANPLPTAITLAQLALAGNAGWQDAITAGDADVACVFQSGNWRTYYHIANYGWVLDSDPTYAVRDNYFVPATTGILVSRQSSGTSPIIHIPLTYTIN